MDKHEIAKIFYKTSQLLDLKGENPFKIRAYENAAQTIDSLTDDIETLANTGKLTSVKGIGANLAAHIEEILKTGTFKEHEELKKTVPDGVVRMLAIPGLGPKRVKLIWEKLKIKTIGELELACQRNLIKDMPGMGEKTQEKILEGIEMLKTFSGKRLFAEAKPVANEVLNEIASIKETIRCDLAGSLRRCREIIGDIDILVSSSSPEKVMQKFISLPLVDKVVQHGETKSEVILKNGMQCDLRVVTDEEYPFALLYFTGSKEHNIAMRALAKKAGYKLNEYGIFKGTSGGTLKGESEKPVHCKSEMDIFKFLGLQYIEPEMREDMGEIEAAAKRKLPKLIEEEDLVGIIHCHSTYSDGKSSILEMANAAKKNKFHYIAICDHSKSSTVAGGLSESEVKKQHKEIDGLNKTLKGIKILKGIEVDILPDGTLDYGDSLLSKFDVVVASIHSRFGMTEKEMTDRIVKGISNPNVDIFAHPTGRLLLARDPYAVNLKTVIDAAVKNKVAIEINAHPQRLDLDWRWCKYAKEKGIKFAICPDAHDASHISDVVYGIQTARKGWLEKEDVLNCLSIEKFLETLK